MDAREMLKQVMAPLHAPDVHRALAGRHVTVSLPTVYRWRAGQQLPSWLLWPHLVAVLSTRPPALVRRVVEAYAGQSPEPSIVIWSALREHGPTDLYGLASEIDQDVEYVEDVLHRLRQRGVAVDADGVWWTA